MNLEDFLITEDNGLRLIVPSFEVANKNSLWTKDNKWYRSRIETLGGDTVSQSFGKFLNIGQGGNLGVSIQDIHTKIQNGEDVYATLKLDGSCLIRSVYKNKVIFRTRGSFTYTFHDKAEEEIAEFIKRYPKLNDPNWQNNRSLLFEWVTPNFPIVINYPEICLTLIGAVNHSNRHLSKLSYVTLAELAQISKESGVPLIEYFKIESVKDWYNLYYSILKDRQIEGYVIRLDNEQSLVKVKAELYITKHSLKSEMSYNKLVDLWINNDCISPNLLIEQLEKLYDEEVCQWALPYILSLENNINKWNSAKDELVKLHNSMADWSRKDYAIKMQEIYKDQHIMFSAAMMLYGGQQIDKKIIKKFMEQNEISTD